MTNVSPDLSIIPGLIRAEDTPLVDMQQEVVALTHSVYKHDDIYGQVCTVWTYVDCPPEVAFEYMAEGKSLEEWTYSVRKLEPSHLPDVLVGDDLIYDQTRIYVRTESNREAMTVDYHCAWDQGEHLWMIYLNRVVPAERVLGKRGCVITWSNFRHPHYDRNPYPEKAPPNRPWVGELWDMFYGGHLIEIQNLKRILEHRYAPKG